MRIRIASARAPLVLAALTALTCVRPVFGHHAFAAEYDERRQVILIGNITRVDWANPHAHFFLSVRDASGRFSSWDLELASPNTLQRGGWTRKSLKVGEVVKVNGYLAKDGANVAHAKDIWLPNGRKVLAGSAPEGNPTQ